MSSSSAELAGDLPAARGFDSTRPMPIARGSTSCAPSTRRSSAASTSTPRSAHPAPGRAQPRPRRGHGGAGSCRPARSPPRPRRSARAHAPRRRDAQPDDDIQVKGDDISLVVHLATDGGSRRRDRRHGRARRSASGSRSTRRSPAIIAVVGIDGSGDARPIYHPGNGTGPTRSIRTRSFCRVRSSSTKHAGRRTLLRDLLARRRSCLDPCCRHLRNAALPAGVRRPKSSSKKKSHHVRRPARV